MIDSDVVAWFETHTVYGETHLAKMNRILRLYVAKAERGHGTESSGRGPNLTFG